MKLSPIFGLPIAEPDDARRDFPTQVDDPRTLGLEQQIRNAVPAGAVQAFAGTAAPEGWLLCNGQAVSRTTYAALFAVCSTTYGVGDGSSTFNLPNLSGRVPVGYDNTQTEFNAVGKSGGAKAHAHGLGDEGFADVGYISTSPHLFMRRLNSPGWAATIQAATALPVPAASSTANASGAALSGSTKSAAGLPPYLTLNYLIKT